MILEIDPHAPERHLICEVVNILREGGVIAYPTDTIYGIGCDIFNKRAIERIYSLKKIPTYKPLSFICADLKEISKYAQVSNNAYRIMKRLLPGPYTFILPATKLVPKVILPKRRSVGIRVPDCTISQKLVESLGNPIISTSASVSEEILSDPMDIDRKFRDCLDLVIDGGILPNDASSVIDLTEDPPVVLRAGKGDVDMFE